jgi:small subunit ribosomal protein S4
MARYIGPKHKLQRKTGTDLSLKTNAVKVAKRLSVKPGQHGSKGRSKVSDYGVQLKEKQKLKFIYGLTEKQLRKLYVEASKNPTATGAALLGLLERRLDNVVFRVGWASTRAAARQFVSHAHIQVNGRKMSIPSYTVKVGDVITVRSRSTSVPMIADALKAEDKSSPAWLEVKQAAAKVARFPERKESTDLIEEPLVVEFYSR